MELMPRPVPGLTWALCRRYKFIVYEEALRDPGTAESCYRSRTTTTPTTARYYSAESTSIPGSNCWRFY
eukprot:2378208-Rhodomonas_salina.2